jgi:hypothetical protein
MKKTSIALAAMALAGCASFDDITFENRVACTVAGDKAVLVSEYGGWIGISSKISDADLPKLIEACKK